MGANSTRDHWWWRPGWRPGRSFYTWHVTFADDSTIGELVDKIAPTLTRMPTMEPVAREGLHITVQGIGFTDEVTPADIDRIGEAAMQRLADRAPFDVLLGPPTVDVETIGMPVADPAGFEDVRDNLQLAIADVWGIGHVPEYGDPFTPHLSLAYSTGVAPLPSLEHLVERDGLADLRHTERVEAVSLIELNRDHHRYEWREVLQVPMLGADR